MLEWIAMLALTGSDIETAACTLQYEMEEYRVEMQRLDCPNDVSDAAALQSLADALLARVDNPVRFQEYRDPYMTDDVEFEYADGRWRLPEPIEVMKGSPAYPMMPISRGLQALCGLAYTIRIDGRARDIDVTCDAYNPDDEPVAGRGFHSSARRAIRGSRWLIPMDSDEVCEESELLYQMAGSTPKPWADGEVSDAPRCAGSN